MDIIKALRSIRVNRRQVRDNDFFSDRLCHRHTNFILLIFIAITTLKRLFSSPINCWVPAELKRYEKYMNRYCWVKGTYYINDFNSLDELSFDERHETLLRYYQWVQIIILFQAFLFYLPRILWTFISNKILNYDLFEMVDAGKSEPSIHLFFIFIFLYFKRLNTKPMVLIKSVHFNLLFQISHKTTRRIRVN